MKVRKLMRRIRQIREKLAERNGLQHWLARKALPVTQSLGFSLLGDHFYEPVPNIKFIREHYVDEPRQLPGFLATPSWAENMERVVGPYIAEYLASPAYEKYGKKNWFYSGWDAAYYYCLIRSRKPRLITEMGRGISTWIAAEAIERNAAEGSPGEIVSIDPYFRGDNSTASTRIVTAELQQIPTSEREALLRADILFIDSSHVAKWGSDVLDLFAFWIPFVGANALVHIHDIFTPYDYPRAWLVQEKRFWNEQYILESFIAFNAAFKIECPLYYLFRNGSLKQLAERVNAPQLADASGGAIWLDRIEFAVDCETHSMDSPGTRS
ncbi:MAG: class I SAM-dependent methyltransferase [Terracidiphilus sp.]